mmetsp:Transcript_102384/g.285270  ORF Transcript_102384/g.285270 Transcript_102384/m.285270 type:complete len:496 (+) Transcript_102384:93-1580(+)
MVWQGEKDLVGRIRAFQRAVQANKRCADCVERGPTYVCLDFQTFVCQTCSGLHREFGHKIKSISLSQWSPAEVDAIEAGGNERAAQKWLDRLSREEHPEPDSSDLDKLREFLKLKYIEKSWLTHKKLDRSQQEVPANTAKGGDSEVANAQAVQKQLCPTEHVPANVGDLLSDCGSSAANFVPPLLPTGVAGDVAPLGSDCGAVQWTADFGSPSDTIIPGPGASAEGLIDLDFCCTTTAPCDATLPKEPASKPQEIDTVGVAKSPVAEPAEEPAPRASTPTKAVGASAGTASEASEAQPPTLGDQLREAVLHGTTGDLMQLYRRCSEPPPRPALPPGSQERLAAYAAFDELGAAPGVPEAGPRPSAPMMPCSGPLPRGPAPPAVGPQHSSPSKMLPEQLAQLMPQKYGMMTPQQLDQLSPQELVQMQLMIQSALQVRAQAAAPLPWPAAGSGATQRLPAPAVAAAPDRTPSPPKQFGDLIAAFTEKNPIAGFGIQA